jgi:septation ring formation regulator EzrA
MLLHRSGLNYYRDQLRDTRANPTFSYHDEDLAEFQKAMSHFHDDLQTINHELNREASLLPAMYQKALNDHIVGSKPVETIEEHIATEQHLINRLQSLLHEITSTFPEEDDVRDGQYTFSDDARTLFKTAVDVLNELEHICRQTGDELNQHIRRLDDFKDYIQTLRDAESDFAANIKSWVGDKQSTAGKTRV